MQIVSDRFESAIGASHQVATLAEVLVAGEAAGELGIDAGTVTLDQTAATRGRCDVVLTPSVDLVPGEPGDLLTPYGNEIRLSRGITFADGSVELVGLGVFRLDETTIDDTGVDLQIRVTGLDRSARIIDARFEAPYQVDVETPVVTAILAVLRDAWPDVPVSSSFPAPDSAVMTPTVIGEEGGDRWAFAQNLAEAIGHDLYFDGAGELRLTPSATLSTGSPVCTLAEGEGGLLVQASRRWNRRSAFNRVIATGENAGLDIPPPRGVATDDNPSSPTYYFGPFGKVPRFYSSSFISSNAQATDAAAAILARELGTTEEVSFGSIVLPHLEPGDVARITRARAGVDEDHVVDALTIPLSAEGVMTGSTRALQVT